VELDEQHAAKLPEDARAACPAGARSARAVVEPARDRSYAGDVGSAIGLWVALTVAAPASAPPAKLASLRPINLNLSPAAPPAKQQALPPGMFTMPPLKPPSRPAWLPPWFLPDPSRTGGGYGSSYAHSGHGGHALGGGRSAHGRGGCHGGGHH
jgi:hypothetical protein